MPQGHERSIEGEAQSLGEAQEVKGPPEEVFRFLLASWLRGMDNLPTGTAAPIIVEMGLDLRRRYVYTFRKSQVPYG